MPASTAVSRSAATIADLAKATAKGLRELGVIVVVQPAYQQLWTQKAKFDLLVEGPRLRHRPQGERARRAQRASARHDRRLPGIRRLGAVELLGLGNTKATGAWLESQCLEVRLRHVVTRRARPPSRATSCGTSLGITGTSASVPACASSDRAAWISLRIPVAGAEPDDVTSPRPTISDPISRVYTHADAYPWSRT